MSHDDALLALTRDLRTHLDAHAPSEGSSTLIRGGQWWAEQRRRLRAAQPFLYGSGLILLGLEALFAWFLFELRGGTLSSDVIAPVVLVFAAPFLFAGVAWWLAHQPRFWAQLTARAMFWGLGLLIVAFQGSMLRGYLLATESVVMSVVSATAMICTLACVLVLLKLDDHWLHPPHRTAFEPVAHRSLLTLSLVMGLADAVILALVGALSLSDPGMHSVIRLGLAAVLATGAWGLSRLRVWGLAVMALGNLLEVFAIGTGAFDSLGPLLFTLLATAVVQLLLPVPVYGAMLLPASQPEANSKLWRRHLPRVILIAAAVFSVAQFLYTALSIAS
ncbi:MAG: hypothetical protein AAGA54_19260 [Myxococcota bacterium]